VFRLHWILLFVVTFSSSTFSSSVTLADDFCVQFDVAQSISAEDASTTEFLADHPNEKQIRIRIPISALFHADQDPQLQFLYLVSGPTTSPFQIVDYAPRTILTTDVKGLISTEQAEDTATSIGINALAPPELHLKADATANHSAGSRNSQRMEVLPPKQLLSASGTMHRGVSAYFKLKPSTQTTLEGSKTFEVVARVPKEWRASLLYVNCAAFGKSKVKTICGQRGFVVGVHLAGDEAARRSVEQLASTQQQLELLARKHAKFIEEQRFPSMGHRLGGALSVVKPKIPNRWLNQLLTSDDFHSFERHLPQTIRAAATNYRQARAEVISFAGKS